MFKSHQNHIITQDLKKDLTQTLYHTKVMVSHHFVSLIANYFEYIT